MKGAPRISAGFFDDALREANVCDLYLLSNALTKHVVSYAFVYPNPMSHITTPLQHHVNAPSILFPHSGATPSHTGKLSQTPKPDPTLSAGLET